jgi:hypothetical protein
VVFIRTISKSLGFSTLFAKTIETYRQLRLEEITMTVKELIDMLMGFPEDEKVMIPDFNSNLDHEVKNVVLTNNGVLLDY